MSIFSKIGKALKGAAQGFLTGGPAGAVIGGAAGAFGGGGGGRIPPTYRMSASGFPVPRGGGLPTLRTLPGAGALRIPPIQITKALPAIGRVAAGAATAKYVYDAFGNLVPHRRRRSKGITASELKGFKRVARILHDYQKIATKKAVKAPSRRKCA